MILVFKVLTSKKDISSSKNSWIHKIRCYGNHFSSTGK